MSVSVIFANESRDAVRPVMVDFLLDAERAAAKENNLRETRRSHCVSVDEKGARAPQKFRPAAILGARQPSAI